MASIHVKIQSYVWLLAALLLTSCTRPAPLLRPNGVAVAADGSIYVMDRGNYRIVRFDAAGNYQGAFGNFGVGPADIHTGWDLALDDQGVLYFCNSAFSADGDLIWDGVKAFTTSGEFVRTYGGMDYALDDTNYRPYGVDVDAAGRVYLADFDTSTLRIYAPDGAHLGTFFGELGSGPGEFNGINDVAVDDTRNLIYLLDNINSRIQQFDLTFDVDSVPTLTYRAVFGEYGDEPGQLAYPQGIAVAENTGRVYVADHANRRVQAYDIAGNVVGIYTPPDIETWQVLQVAVDRAGAIYATDSYNNVIWVFAPTGEFRQRIEVRP